MKTLRIALIVALGVLCAAGGWSQTSVSPFPIVLRSEAGGELTSTQYDNAIKNLRNFFTQSDSDFHLFLAGDTGTPPTSCEPPQVWIDMDATAASQFLVCTSTDTWTAQGGGASFTDLDTDYGAETVTSNWNFQGLLNFDSATEGILRLPASASRPGTCTIGEIYFDNDETAGLNLYGCTATNTWTLLGDGAGGGSAGGSDTQLQYNNGGSTLGGIAEMTYDDATGKVTYSDATEGNFVAEVTQSGNASLEAGWLKGATSLSSGGLGVELIFRGEDSDNEESLGRVVVETTSSTMRNGELWFDTINSAGTWQSWKSLGVDASGVAFTGESLHVGTDGAAGGASDLKFFGNLWSDGLYFCTRYDKADALVLNYSARCSAPVYQFEVWADSAATDHKTARFAAEGGNGNIVIESDPTSHDLFLLGSDAGNTTRFQIWAAEDEFSIFHSPIRFQPTDTPPTCDGTNLGALYYDTSDDRFKKCDATVAWVNLEGGAFSPSTLDTDYGTETVTSAWTKSTADLTVDGVEVDFEAGGSEGYPRLAQSTTPPTADCDAAAEAGRLYYDSDQDTDGSLMICRGASGWKDVDDDGAGGTLPNQVINVPGTALLPIEHAADSYYESQKVTGTNADIWTAGFDATTDQCGGFSFMVSGDLDTGGTVEFRAIYTSETGSTSEVVWDVREAAIGDSESWDASLTTRSSSAANCAGPSPANDIENCTWTVAVSTLGWAADDWVELEFCRDPDHADDTNSNDQLLLQLVIEIPRS